MHSTHYVYTFAKYAQYNITIYYIYNIRRDQICEM